MAKSILLIARQLTEPAQESRVRFLLDNDMPDVVARVLVEAGHEGKSRILECAKLRDCWNPQATLDSPATSTSRNRIAEPK